MTTNLGKKTLLLKWTVSGLLALNIDTGKDNAVKEI